MLNKVLNRIVDTRNQYYYLVIPPFVFVIFFICLIKGWSNTRKEHIGIRGNLLLKAFLLFFIDIMIIGCIIPIFVSAFLGWKDFMNSGIYTYYYNCVMVMFGIHLIKIQER